MYLKGVKFFKKMQHLFEGHLALIHHKSFCFISTHSHISLITRKEYQLEGVYGHMSHSKYLIIYIGFEWVYFELTFKYFIRNKKIKRQSICFKLKMLSYG